MHRNSPFGGFVVCATEGTMIELTKAEVLLERKISEQWKVCWAHGCAPHACWRDLRALMERRTVNAWKYLYEKNAMSVSGSFYANSEEEQAKERLEQRRWKIRNKAASIAGKARWNRYREEKDKTKEP